MAKISIRDPLRDELMAKYPNRTASEALAMLLIEINRLEKVLSGCQILVPSAPTATQLSSSTKDER